MPKPFSRLTVPLAFVECDGDTIRLLKLDTECVCCHLLIVSVIAFVCLGVLVVRFDSSSVEGGVIAQNGSSGLRQRGEVHVEFASTLS